MLPGFESNVVNRVRGIHTKIQYNADADFKLDLLWKKIDQYSIYQQWWRKKDALDPLVTYKNNIRNKNKKKNKLIFLFYHLKYSRRFIVQQYIICMGIFYGLCAESTILLWMYKNSFLFFFSCFAFCVHIFLCIWTVTRKIKFYLTHRICSMIFKIYESLFDELVSKL